MEYIYDRLFNGSLSNMLFRIRFINSILFLTGGVQSENEGVVDINTCSEASSSSDGSIHSNSSNKSSPSSVKCTGFSESSNDNLTCIRSFELSCDLQMDCDESELEVQVIFVVFTFIIYPVICLYSNLVFILTIYILFFSEAHGN